jgi:hypothetical protein
MTEASRQAALGAVLRQMRAGNALSRRVAAASVLLLRGPLREIDDKLCRIEPDALARLAVAGVGMASVN